MDRSVAVARRLGAHLLLLQSPASFTPGARNRDRLRAFFDAVPREDLRCVWEPRGRWDPAVVGTLCGELDLIHGVDPLQSTAATSGPGYFRLHGVGGYQHRHSDDELRRIARRVSDHQPAHVLFNNSHEFEDACRFRDLLFGPRQLSLL